MRKKLMSLLLAIVLCFSVFSFTGCKDKGTVLKILENDTAFTSGYLDELIAAFNAEYEGEGIAAENAKMSEYTDLESNGPYGYGPDVIYQAHDIIMKYAGNKHVMPIDTTKVESFSQTPEEVSNAYKITEDGVDYICGVPVNAQAPLLFYRKDLIPQNWRTAWDADANEVPDMIENMSAMYKFSEQLRNDGKYGLMYSMSNEYFSSGFLFTYGAYVFGKNNTDTKDIGLDKGDSYLGAKVMMQLAEVMNADTIDDSITKNREINIAKGLYFATICTPDRYSTFVDKMVLEGHTKEFAMENIVMTSIPKLPANGDLINPGTAYIESKVMGGINGYGISAYTKQKDAAMKFVDFATKSNWIKRRCELLGIAPTRSDVAEEMKDNAHGISKIIKDQLDDGTIILMPSIKEGEQIWTPLTTFLQDIATDVLQRASKDKKYLTDDSVKKGLQTVSKQIYDAIHTLS